MIDLSTATYIGPGITDREIFDRLPADYREFLGHTNGCVLFGGGLHIRGACTDPDWHSLRKAWIGEDSFHVLYSLVRDDDIPFAQDCLGDQLLLRAGSVVRLSGETGKIEDRGVGFTDFLKAATADPVQFLSLRLLETFKEEGGTLQPGQLLSVYPPLCMEESAKGVSLRAISALDRIRFLADLAAQISALPDGTNVRFVVE